MIGLTHLNCTFDNVDWPWPGKDITEGCILFIDTSAMKSVQGLQMVYYLITVTSPQGWLTLGLVQDILSKSLQKSVKERDLKTKHSLSSKPRQHEFRFTECTNFSCCSYKPWVFSFINCAKHWGRRPASWVDHWAICYPASRAHYRQVGHIVGKSWVFHSLTCSLSWICCCGPLWQLSDRGSRQWGQPWDSHPGQEEPLDARKTCCTQSKCRSPPPPSPPASPRPSACATRTRHLSVRSARPSCAPVGTPRCPAKFLPARTLNL